MRIVSAACAAVRLCERVHIFGATGVAVALDTQRFFRALTASGRSRGVSGKWVISWARAGRCVASSGSLSAAVGYVGTGSMSGETALMVADFVMFVEWSQYGSRGDSDGWVMSWARAGRCVASPGTSFVAIG